MKPIDGKWYWVQDRDSEDWTVCQYNTSTSTGFPWANGSEAYAASDITEYRGPIPGPDECGELLRNTKQLETDHEKARFAKEIIDICGSEDDPLYKAAEAYLIAYFQLSLIVPASQEPH